jgi:hypothetical protein
MIKDVLIGLVLSVAVAVCSWLLLEVHVLGAEIKLMKYRLDRHDKVIEYISKQDGMNRLNYMYQLQPVGEDGTDGKF